MKKIPLVLTVLIMMMFLASCVRTTTYVRERLDQRIEGNRGYIRGDIPPYIKEREVSRTRTMMQIEVELPPYAGWEGYKKTEDKEIWGNRGIIVGESKLKPDFPRTTPAPEEAQPEPKRRYTK